jgi:hypothetical protein
MSASAPWRLRARTFGVEGMVMTRFSRLRLLVTATILALAAGGAALRAQQATSGVRPDNARNGQGRQITLRDQLRVGLKAVTKADFAFIDLVVLKVNAGVLPRKLVDSTFLWARRRVEAQRRQYYKRPMVYFQPALVLRARAVGVRL